MKKVIYCLVAGVLLAALCLGCAPTPAPKAEPITLKVVAARPKPSSTNVPFFEWEKRLMEKTKGELIIEFAGGPEAISAFELGAAVQKGVIDMAYAIPNYYADILPETLIGGIVQTTPMEDRKSGFHDLLVKRHEEVGLYWVSRMCHGTVFHLFTDDRVEKLADLKGLRFRSAPLYDALFKELGITGITMEMGEVYTAIERGLVDGYAYPMHAIPSAGLHEVTKYVVDHGFWTGFTGIIVNLDRWSSLPKHLQDAMVETAIEVEPWMLDFYREDVKKGREVLQDAGAEFIKLSPQEGQQLIDSAYRVRWEEIFEKCPETGPIAQKLVSK